MCFTRYPNHHGVFFQRGKPVNPIISYPNSSTSPFLVSSTIPGSAPRGTNAAQFGGFRHPSPTKEKGPKDGRSAVSWSREWKSWKNHAPRWIFLSILMLYLMGVSKNWLYSQVAILVQKMMNVLGVPLFSAKPYTIWTTRLGPKTRPCQLLTLCCNRFYSSHENWCMTLCRTPGFRSWLYSGNREKSGTATSWRSSDQRGGMSRPNKKHNMSSKFSAKSPIQIYPNSETAKSCKYCPESWWNRLKQNLPVGFAKWM